MKLLLDQNLSSRLVDRLANEFAGSIHVRSIGLERGDDQTIWDYALAHGCTIVTRDSDFAERAQVSNPHPKIVWIRRPNCSTADVEAMLTRHRQDMERLGSEPELRYLILL